MTKLLNMGQAYLSNFMEPILIYLKPSPMLDLQSQYLTLNHYLLVIYKIYTQCLSTLDSDQSPIYPIVEELRLSMRKPLSFILAVVML